MPSQRPRLKMLKPRVQELLPSLTPARSVRSKTLKQRQAENGRTLALNGEAWRRLRASVLADEPLCRDCTARGLIVSATEVDHRDNDPSNNDRANLVPLCKSCHSIKTQADMGKKGRSGCDTQGMPLDPAHPWNATATGLAGAKPCALLQESPATGRDEPHGPLRVTAKCPS